MSESLVGSTIAGKYLVKSLLGKGGMGAVYEGEHIEIGKRVAIKVIDPSHAGSEEVAARFKREARAASRVESEHIVQVFDVGSDPNAGLYMVMEILTGEDLSHRLQREQRLSVPVAIRLTLQAAKALAKAHAAGVVHRDLKPANLFLTTRDDGTTHVKILDFGISKLARDEGPTSGSMTDAPRPAGAAPLTRHGSVIGTPQYMSPEQAQGLAIDHRTDVWSLGAVLYEMVSGTSAYADLATYEQTIIQIVTKKPKPLAELVPTVPRELAVLVHDALTHDLEARLADCTLFAERLAAMTDSPKKQGDFDAAIAPAVSSRAVARTDSKSGSSQTTEGVSLSGAPLASVEIPKRSIRAFAIAAAAIVAVIAVLIGERLTAPTKSITVAATPSIVEPPASATTVIPSVVATIAPITAESASSAALASSSAPKIAPLKKSTSTKPAGKGNASTSQPDGPPQFGAAGVSTAF